MNLTSNDIQQGRINDQLGTQLESLSAQVEANVERGRNVVAEWKSALSENSSRMARSVDRYTRENPWAIVCSAVLGGMLLGLLCGAQRSSRRALF